MRQRTEIRSEESWSDGGETELPLSTKFVRISCVKEYRETLSDFLSTKV